MNQTVIFKVGILNWQNYLNDELELMTAKIGVLYVDIKAKDFGDETVQKVSIGFVSMFRRPLFYLARRSIGRGQEVSA